MKRARGDSDGDENPGFEGAQEASSARRDKRRKDIVDRIERLRKESTDRRESIFHDILTSMHAAHMSLLSTPHPTHGPYLLRLSELSIQRDVAISASRVQTKYKQRAARKLYNSEVERIEDEYAMAQKGIRERLLEACDERARKLREEKDSVELNIDTMLDPQPRAHATRQRPSRTNRYLEMANGVDAAPTNGHGSSRQSTAVPLPNPSSLPSEITLPAKDTFPFSFLPASPMMASFPTSAQATAPNGSITTNALLNPSALLSTLASLPTSRSSRRKHPPAVGLPAHIINPAYHGLPHIAQQYNIQPGRYDFIGKSLQALKALQTEEISDDLEKLRRKGASRRPRTTRL